MKKIVLIYGLIAGAIVGSMLLITMPLYESGTLHFENGQWLGYTTMVIALSMVFFGIKSFRDNHSGGSITFWNGLKVGLLITLIASLIYALSWEVSYNTMKGDFIKMMGEKQIEKMKKEGATEASIEEAKKQTDDFAVKYRNRVFRFTLTLLEIEPVGIVISLLSAGLLRRKELLPSTN
jgi:Protein of unknown function (DUF4199)